MATLAGLVLFLVLAAMQVPRLVEPGRYRGAIAAIASARLGRSVSIAGDVGLRLLPDVVLTATRVTLADRGDGISATIGALRLRVDLAPLLRGRIVPRALVLDNAALRLPWPLPRDITAPESARLPKGFSAQLEGGSLQLGGMTLAGFSAALRSDADTGAFAANGVVDDRGQSWRYAGLLGAPGADGVSTLNLTVDGQGAAQNTGGYIRARLLPSGVVDGMVTARGPDLSRLIAAPATPWSASGKLTATGLQIQAPALDISIGNSPGHASLDLNLERPFLLRGAMAVGQIDVASWAQTWNRPWHSELPMRLNLSVEAGRLIGGAIRNMQAMLALDATEARLEHGSATLPGGALLKLDGVLNRGFDGRFSLIVPDMRTTLRWLHPASSAVVGALPGSVLTRAALDGQVQLDIDRLALTGLTGSLDQAGISGQATFAFGDRPKAKLDLSTNRIDLAPWLRAEPDDSALLSRLGQAASSLETDVHFSAKQAVWHAANLSDLVVDLHTDTAGLDLKGLAFAAGATQVRAAGKVRSDGTVADAKLSVTAADATRIQASLPQDWPIFPALWSGNFGLAMTASGTPQAVAIQLRADLGDLRLEAEATLDMPRQSADATLTLRHPGAPRLLHALGIDSAADWLDTGSVALAAHVHAGGSQVLVHDFALSAAALKLGGKLDADFSGAMPHIQAAIRAENLALPLPPTHAALPVSWLSGWDGTVQLDADNVVLGGRRLAQSATASFILADQVLSATMVKATVGAAGLAAEAVIDVSGDQPRMALHGTLTDAALGPALTGLPADMIAGSADLHADLLAEGANWPALRATVSGKVDGVLNSVTVRGIDLAALKSLLPGHAGKLRQALQNSLSAGATAALNGDFSATLASGFVSIGAAHLAGTNGSIDATGDVDLADQTADMRLTIWPAVASPPALGMRLVGPLQNARRVADVAPGLLWAAKAHPAAHK